MLGLVGSAWDQDWSLAVPHSMQASDDSVHTCLACQCLPLIYVFELVSSTQVVGLPKIFLHPQDIIYYEGGRQIAAWTFMLETVHYTCGFSIMNIFIHEHIHKVSKREFMRTDSSSQHDRTMGLKVGRKAAHENSCQQSEV